MIRAFLFLLAFNAPTFAAVLEFPTPKGGIEGHFLIDLENETVVHRIKKGGSLYPFQVLSVAASLVTDVKTVHEIKTYGTYPADLLGDTPVTLQVTKTAAGYTLSGWYTDDEGYPFMKDSPQDLPDGCPGSLQTLEVERKG